MNIESIQNKKLEIRNMISQGSILSPMELHFNEDELNIKEFIIIWYESIFNFDLFVDRDFEEAIFHSPSNIQIKNFASQEQETCDLTEEDFQLSLEILCLKNSISWNTSNPFASFDLNLKGHNFRASLTHFSSSKEHGSKLFLRKHSPKAFPMESFHHDSSILHQLVEGKKNILICGGTGSGKTSLLNSMLTRTDTTGHLLIVEDTFELLSPHENTTRLLASDHVSLKEHMACAMRMSPKRIILGELRSNEAESFLLAMNSGHKGLMSTIHANSAVDAISRLSLLIRFYSRNSLDYNLVTKLICSNVDYVIHMENKRISEVIEVFGSESGQVFHEDLLKTA